MPPGPSVPICETKVLLKIKSNILALVRKKGAEVAHLKLIGYVSR